MSSILTNTSAMVALQTLRGINSNLAKTQNEISTGKSVGTARDNAAVWAISKTMEADVKGFKGITDSLALGKSTLAVASKAAETVTDLLTQMKGRIVAAQEENVDRGKIQDDIVALREQIASVTTTAQFNGLNLLSNRATEAGSGRVDILSSLDRSADGSVTAANISVAKRDLGTTASSITVTTAGLAGTDLSDKITDGAASAALAGAAVTPAPRDITFSAGNIAAGDGFSISLSASAGDLFGGANNLNTANNNTIRYIARDGDTGADVAAGLAAALNSWLTERGGEGLEVTVAGTENNILRITNTSGAAANTVTIEARAFGSDDTVIGGRLEALNNIDVTSSIGANSALEQIEGLIQTSIASAAAFGSAQGRVETQSSFISGLIDSLTTGIGSLVDADMEAASARLQALQVQQQLATQSLSIANQQPQNILALFR